MNPFERIQALTRTEPAPAPTPASTTAPAATPEERPPAASSSSPAAEIPSSPAPSIAPSSTFASLSLASEQATTSPMEPASAPSAPPAAATPAPAPVPASLFAPAPELRPMPHLAAAHAATEKVSLSLASVLKGCKTHEIGMSPDHIPSWVRVDLPLDLIRPQLLSGKVTLLVTQVMAALEPELRNLITPSRPDLSVDLPLGELRKALPHEPFPEPAAAAPESSIPALFQPFSPSPMGTGLSKTPDLVFGTPTAPPPSPPPAASFFQAAAPVEVSSPSPTDGAWPLPPGTPEPEPAPAVESAELTSAFSFLKEEPEMAAVAPAEEVVVDIKPTNEEISPAPSSPAPALASPPARATASEPAGITKSAIRVIPPTPANQSASQMMLRALLNTDEPLDPPTVVQLMACQPGIVAVACLRDGTCLASAGNGSAEAEHFLNQAPKLHHHVQPLIQLTGSLDTETFSMNSGPLIITFSLQSELTLGVLHDPRTQGPALRERITLIARELTPLLGPPAA